MKQSKITNIVARIPARKTKKSEQSKLSTAVSWAHIVTAGALLLTLGAAIYAAVTAYKEYRVVYDQSQAIYNQSQAAYNDYQARTRPYLVVHDLQFYDVGNDSTYLLIDVTNSGERPAVNISIQDIEVCVISGSRCTPLYTGGGSDIKTILYPGRINTTRINVDKNVYSNISPTDTITVSMKYGYGNIGDKDYKGYEYEANLRQRPNSDIWSIESETGD